jgi:hypothetical protein
MNGVPINNMGWAIGRKLRNGRFKIRRIVWGLILARGERHPDEEIRACSITIEREWKSRHPKPIPRKKHRDDPPKEEGRRPETDVAAV